MKLYKSISIFLGCALCIAVCNGMNNNNSNNNNTNDKNDPPQNSHNNGRGYQNLMASFTDIFEALIERARGALIEGRLLDFDALVGDTACHLRALFVASLYQATISGKEISRPNLEALAFTYALTLCQTAQRAADGFLANETNSEHKLPEAVGIKNTKKNRALLSPLQRTVADRSLAYLQGEARLLEGQLGAELRAQLDRQVIFDQNYRPLAGCFPELSVVLARAAAQGIPIVLRLRLSFDIKHPSQGLLVMVFTPVMSSEGLRFILTNPDSIDETQAALVIDGYTTRFEGYRDLESRITAINEFMSELNLERALLANAATHPQFAGNVKNTPLDLQGLSLLAQEFEALREYARAHGCCSENRSQFCIDHLCAALVRQALVYNFRGNAVPNPAQMFRVGPVIFYRLQELLKELPKEENRDI